MCSFMNPSACVQCGQLLPGNSKLADLQIQPAEAEGKRWASEAAPDGMVKVKMCLQCQISRSERQKKSL